MRLFTALNLHSTSFLHLLKQQSSIGYLFFPNNQYSLNHLSKARALYSSLTSQFINSKNLFHYINIKKIFYELISILSKVVASKARFSTSIRVSTRYLGCLHSIQYAKLSLVCDIQEIFRVLIEDFTISYSLT